MAFHERGSAVRVTSAPVGFPSLSGARRLAVWLNSSDAVGYWEVAFLKRPTRRQFLGALSAGVIVGVAGYSSLIEPYEVSIEQVPLTLPRLPEAFQGLRIVQLSDLHYGPFTGDREIRKAVVQANALHPDIAVLTGDFVTVPILGRDYRPKLAEADACGRILSELRAPLGTFACLGNHDIFVDANRLSEILSSHGIHVIRNGAQALEREGARVWMAGVDDVLAAHADLDRTLANTPRDEFSILLAHEPDFADAAAAYPIDLQLSGHSHGGQIRVPLAGALYYPPLARKYPRGHYRVGNLHLYTNRGIGTIGLPIRLNAPPEVTLLTLSRS